MNGFLLDSWLAGEWWAQKGKCSYRKLLAPRFVDCFFLNCVFLRKYKHFYSTYLWYRLKNIDGKNHCRWQKKYLFDFGVNNPFKVIFTHLCIKPMTILCYSLKKKPFGVFFDIFTLKYILIAVLLVIGMYISTLQPAPLTWVTDFSTSSTSE